MKTKKVSKKLNHVKIDPFFIKQQKKSVNYELNLFSDIKIHSIFHVSLLKSANSKTFIQNTFHFQYENDDKYEGEKILKQNDQQYFIKWRDYSTSKNTWKSIENFANCQHLLKDFRQTQKKTDASSLSLRAKRSLRKKRRWKNRRQKRVWKKWLFFVSAQQCCSIRFSSSFVVLFPNGRFGKISVVASRMSLLS